MERIGAALADAGAAGAAVLAVGWATVDSDRAATELTDVFGLAADPFAAAGDSVALGARCRVAEGVLVGGRSLVLLEPSTEGRLAATLARVGEGPVAVWLSEDPLDGPLSALRPGPFGPERLIVGGPIHGPHRLLVGNGAGTIAS